MVTEDDVFHDTFQAIIGLAFPEFAEPGVVPLFDEMMEEQILGHNVFAFFMSMNPKDEDSEVMFGAWNPDHMDDSYDGEPIWHPVVHQRFWSIKLDDIRIGDVSLGLCGPDKNCLVTPDSGTSQITFPEWAVTQYESEFPEWVEGECEDDYDWGDLIYVINDIEYPIPSYHWNKRNLDTDTGVSTCKTRIHGLDVGAGLDDLFIVGDTFMQIYYTVFDREENEDEDYPMGRVGFALSKHTAPDVIDLYDTDNNYLSTTYECEESYIDASVCDDYEPSE